MFHFPYGNLHGLNLDWLLAEWKKFKDSFTTAFTTTVTNLPVSSQPTVDVTYDQDANKFNFDFGIPAEVKPQSFQIGYAESSSGTVIPTGVTWLANPPAVAQGNYLWSRTMVVYNDGTFSATYACSRMGVDGTGTPATATPLMDGVGAVGTSDKFAREDHVHPTDTSLTPLTSFNALDSTVTALNTSALKNVTYINETVHVSFSAGTIGTRGYQGTLTGTPPVGKTLLGVAITRISDSQSIIPIAFMSSNVLYLNVYRATTNAVSDIEVDVRFAYIDT